MIIICAWCEREGLSAFLGETTYSEDDELGFRRHLPISHGICTTHKERILSEFRNESAFEAAKPATPRVVIAPSAPQATI